MLQHLFNSSLSSSPGIHVYDIIQERNSKKYFGVGLFCHSDDETLNIMSLNIISISDQNPWLRRTFLV